ncbi:glycoside hydrolase family 78 protein [Bacteroides sp. OttesenSCG-928-E20]|nr:glycoside hydrolase family 78 protein [Bacteroides sp. OttesenSCG-928-N06]MDL2299393.1 glycoside hydrolase family 78 protein [Bacteroides sp. OttesenSCG-928-E20]MDL2306254.1 glycoside hydrolase family 78 protein [Bacteroides sp. OttesenSCG-928-D19]
MANTLKFTLACLSVACGMVHPQAASVVPAALRCEYLINPLGIDVAEPRFSWQLEAIDPTAYGQKQTAYRILVASTSQLLQTNKGDVWDSGEVASNQSVNVLYKGTPLQSGKEYFWKLCVADESGQWTEWSKPAFWSMGLLHQSDWKAQWIGSPQAIGQKVLPEPAYNTQSDPWFRKSFSLSGKPGHAVIYVASVGYHELYVNGHKVNDDVLAPSVTDHNKRARYVTYDITQHLQPGDNAIALWLGVSWSIFPAYQTPDKPAAPLVIAQADIRLSDKECMQIVTDSSWKTHDSPNSLIGHWDAHHFGGELYDATKEIAGWNEAGFDDSQWPSAVTFAPNLLLSAEKTEANKLYQEIEPVAIAEPEPGVYRIDMGTNYTGWFQLQFKAEPGTEVRFEFSEWEKSPVSFGIHSIYKVGNSGEGLFCNRFNYMTGRWVRITGLKEKPSEADIKAWMIRPDYARAGAFECDIQALNDIYRTTLWTFENLSLGNYVVDCPHRERRGYGGDALATTRPALGNYKMGAFYTKWMEDFRDVQDAEGNIPHTAPTYLGGGGPSWSGFCVVLPYEMYRWYGDKRILEESFPTIERWLAFMETKSANDMLVRWGGKWSFLGDWLWPDAWTERSAMEKKGLALGDTRETLFFNNCIWIHNLELAARIADILGNNKADSYRARANEIRKAVHQEFFNPEDNSYVNGYQAYLATALAADVAPKELRAKVWQRLEYEIKVKRNGHFWGGITAGSYLFYMLLDSGRDDLIHLMAMQEDYPGWINMIRKGPGTFFEDWRCSGTALHSSYLYVGSWFIEGLGGIRRPESGFQHFEIEPWMDATNGPGEVRAQYDSMYGRIVSNWKKAGDKVMLDITVPPNTTATLKLQGKVKLLEPGNHRMEHSFVK